MTRGRLGKRERQAEQLRKKRMRAAFAGLTGIVFLGLRGKEKGGLSPPAVLSVASHSGFNARLVAPVWLSWPALGCSEFVHSNLIASIVCLAFDVLELLELPKVPSVGVAGPEGVVVDPKFVFRVFHRKHGFLPLPRSFRIWRMLLCPAATINIAQYLMEVNCYLAKSIYTLIKSFITSITFCNKVSVITFYYSLITFYCGLRAILIHAYFLLKRLIFLIIRVISFRPWQAKAAA